MSYRRLACATLCVLALVSMSCRKRTPASPLHFAREEVSLDVRPGVLEVRAVYHFQCRATQPLGASILYPFPLDSAHPYPDSIDISGFHFQRRDSGVGFTMRFKPGAEDSFSAYYRQPLGSNSATYIVTSTRKWREPIDLARFRVTVPAGFDSVNLNWKPDSVVTADSQVSYFFARKKFFPDHDVTVTWK